MSPLQLKFDANQEHQLQAVSSVVRLFEGLPRYDESFRFSVPYFTVEMETGISICRFTTKTRRHKGGEVFVPSCLPI